MKYFDSGIRFILAVLFVLYGVSKFYPFMPIPPMAPNASKFIGAIIVSGYLWQTVGVLEIFGGLSLILNRTANIGLLLLGPVVVNIILYLLFLQLATGIAPLMMALFLMLSFGFLLFRRRKDWLTLLPV
jgi:putative oxidoreductase